MSDRGALRVPQAGAILVDMSMPATIEQPAVPKAAKPERKLRISTPVREAIHAMVWLGLKRDKAAEHAGMKDNSLYVALRRPDVKAHYLGELDVLRTSERARNIHTLAEVRDQTTNQMARVQAVKALEQLDDVELASGRANSLPGLQIVIVQGGSAAAAVVDVTPQRLTHD